MYRDVLNDPIGQLSGEIQPRIFVKVSRLPGLFDRGGKSPSATNCSEHVPICVGMFQAIFRTFGGKLAENGI
jgi:hypothetical protein